MKYGTLKHCARLAQRVMKLTHSAVNEQCVLQRVLACAGDTEVWLGRVAERGANPLHYGSPRASMTERYGG